MTISPEELISAIEQKNGFPLDPPQIDAIQHGDGPLWIIAGPGTGKTEVLVVRCLKLLCCNGVSPRSIMVTTFTEKAARNLEDRIAEATLYLVNRYPCLANVDPNQLRIGTLHSLCNEILQEYRYVAYQNLRLLDEIESQMFIRDRLARTARQRCTQFQQQFAYLFDNKPYPNLWDWTKAIKVVMDRLVDDRVDITALNNAGGCWQEVALLHDLYEQELSRKYSCDFARLQRFFLDFLNTPQGQLFLYGDGTEQRQSLRYVLVDEYQDTNPIQEEIYFTLTNQPPHNLTVVGDDDQALYRFRGGTVECMVSFGDQCQQRWNISPRRITLVHNHRSDQQIVNWCNSYITSFPQMFQGQARVHGKPPLQPASGRNGNYPAVGLLRENNLTDLANTFADTVLGLLANGIIQDYSQCVLLLRSTKDTPRNAGPYIQALSQRNIPVYNPRSKAFLEQPEVQEILGAFISILDPGLQTARSIKQPGIIQMVNQWIGAYQNIAMVNPDLQTYVWRSQAAIQNASPGERITPAAPTILYRIMAHQPFIAYQANPEQDLRLSKITRLLEAFCSQQGRPLYVDNQQQGVLDQRWLNNFYYIFCGYLDARGMDDDEDEEIICPPGRFPIMTIHQSKGLEFEFVFVGSLGSEVSIEDTHQLEEDLRPYRVTQPLVVYSPGDAAWHDEIRLHYVAYSRAKYALILLATRTQLRKAENQTASFGGQSGLWRQFLQRL